MPTNRTAAPCALAALALLACAGVAHADWTNAGGNAQRNGRVAVNGPDAPTQIWQGSRNSIIAWQPVIEGDRVFMVRQTGFPPSGEPNGSPIVAQDVNTGQELWTVNVPFNTGDWTTWIAGVKNGRVFASRSGNGASVSARMRAYDAATGAFIWESADVQNAGAYDGVVFAPDGDLIVGSFRNIWRIDWQTGATVWVANRQASVSGSCGVAVFGDAVYAVDSAPGGNVLKRFNINTGAFQYQSPTMGGFTAQNTPFVGADGTVYFSRTQNNVATDQFYAFEDTGAALSIRWSVPAGWTTFSEFAVGQDNSVYMITPGALLRRLDPATGATLATTALPVGAAGNLTPRMAVDGAGRVFVNNGQFSPGVFWSFNADLTTRWNVNVPNANIGSPAIASNGTLIIAGVSTNVRAYRTAPPPCRPDLNNDGELTFDDIQLFVSLYNANDPRADFNSDGEWTFDDIQLFVQQYNAGC